MTESFITAQQLFNRVLEVIEFTDNRLRPAKSFNARNACIGVP